MKMLHCRFNEIVDKIQVLSMEIRVPLAPAALEERLKAFFGQGGLGLVLKEECPGRLTFTGGGGCVSATLSPEGDKTQMRIVTREWAVAVKKFVTELP